MSEDTLKSTFEESGSDSEEIIRIPASDILSAAKETPEGYEDIFIEGIHTDDLGKERFILSQEQEDGSFVKLDPMRRIGPDLDNELELYKTKLEEEKKK
jgi:hypothetical protein